MKTIFSISFFALTFFVMALNPFTKYASTPADYGLNYEEISIKTSDNLNLKAWLYRPTETSYKMIILSDDGNGNMSDLIEIATNFVSLGYNVITYDYRGYGESDAFNINPDFYIYTQFALDLNAVIDYVRKNQSKCRNVCLYGQGIGASISLAIGATRCSEISKIIADSPYSTLDDVQKAIKSAIGKEVKLPLGFDKNQLEPKFALKAKGASLNGILLIYGKNDPVYNSDMIKQISSLRSSITKTYVVKNADCYTTFSNAKEDYFKQVKSFL